MIHDSSDHWSMLIGLLLALSFWSKNWSKPDPSIPADHRTIWRAIQSDPSFDPWILKNLILEWFLAMILNSPDPDLIFIPKANYHRIRIFAPEKYSGFSMHSVDLWLFYFWSLNPESWHIQLPECDPENYSRIMNAFHGSVFFIGSLIPGSSQIQLLLINAWFYDHPSWMPPEGVNLGGQHKKSQESMLTHINQSLAIQLFDFKLLMDNISMYMLSYFKRSWHKVNYFL